MKKIRMFVCLAAGALVLVAPAIAQDQNHHGQGQTVVTLLPKHKGEATPSISPQDLKIVVNGKQSRVTNWEPLRGPVELVLLIDGSARTSLGRQMGDIAHFIQSLPPNVESTIAYMDSGRAVMTGPLSTDHTQVLRGLQLPGGFAGSSASPYLCLSNLAKHWPSEDRQARREVLMVTDGVDNFNLGYDPADPYVQAAIADSIRSGLVVYSIYWRSQGIFDQTNYAANEGQNLLNEVAAATGGNNYWIGSGNPVDFKPYLNDLSRRLQNQYELSFVAPLKGEAEVEQLKLKSKAPGIAIDAPEEVLVARTGDALN